MHTQKIQYAINDLYDRTSVKEEDVRIVKIKKDEEECSAV